MNVKKKIKEFFGIVQKAVIALLLLIVYLFGFGVFALIMKLMKVRLNTDTQLRPGSFWEDVKARAVDMNESMRGS